MKGKTVHIVLLVMGGIPEDPEVFENSANAMQRYRQLAKNHLDIDGAIDDMTDDDLLEAVFNRQQSDDDLYLYETEIM